MKRKFRPVVLPLSVFATEKPTETVEKPEKSPEGGRWRELFLLPVKGYRRFLSPMFPPVCRFTPTCSAYCLEAVRRHGVLRGTALTVWRILRCNPFCKGGYDPVPEKKTKRRAGKKTGEK